MNRTNTFVPIFKCSLIKSFCVGTQLMPPKEKILFNELSQNETLRISTHPLCTQGNRYS